jgi:phospholipid/cholesterol/gamma-HCH transport system permease protein
MSPLESQSSAYTISTKRGGNGELTVLLSGRIALENIQALESEILSLLREEKPSRTTFNLAGIDYLDSAGALLLFTVESRARAHNIDFSFSNAKDDTKRIMDLLDQDALEREPLIHERETIGIIELAGDRSLKLIKDCYDLISFLGRLSMALAYSLSHPRSVRWGDVGNNTQRAGIHGLPLVGLISFMLGYVVAIMAAKELTKYSFNIILGAIVAIAMIKEFSPLITAILVAGRSGSAYAAELGTMKINEEVDALETIGYDPIKFLVVPKVIATLMVVPLLTVYSDFCGIIGGLVVGVTDLDISMYTYFQQIPLHISMLGFLLSIFKSVVFALVIAGIGCQRGLKTRGGAEAVGITTTSALVTAIFLIIIFDWIFAEAISYVT